MQNNSPHSSFSDPVELFGDTTYYYGTDADSGSSTLNDYSIMIIRFSDGSVKIERNMDMAESDQYGMGIDNLTNYLWEQIDSSAYVLNAAEIINPGQNQEYVYFVPYSTNSNPIIYNAGSYTGIQKAYYCQCRAGGSLDGTCVAEYNSTNGKYTCSAFSGSPCTDCYGYIFYVVGGVFVETHSI